jgi:hypothetical protein
MRRVIWALVAVISASSASSCGAFIKDPEVVAVVCEYAPEVKGPKYLKYFGANGGKKGNLTFEEFEEAFSDYEPPKWVQFFVYSDGSKKANQEWDVVGARATDDPPGAC